VSPTGQADRAEELVGQADVGIVDKAPDQDAGHGRHDRGDDEGRARPVLGQPRPQVEDNLGHEEREDDGLDHARGQDDDHVDDANGQVVILRHGLKVGQADERGVDPGFPLGERMIQPGEGGIVIEDQQQRERRDQQDVGNARPHDATPALLHSSGAAVECGAAPRAGAHVERTEGQHSQGGQDA
jgi:hypothetical protein